MSAQRTSLDGRWQFRTDPDQFGLRAQWHHQPFTDGPWKTLQIPGFWQQHGEDGDEGVGWYRREFELPAPTEDTQRGICLAGIDETATVWINDIQVSTESPLRQRFAFNADHVTRPGKNAIVIRVPDHGAPGGILRSAWLGTYRHIEDLLYGKHAGTPARASADWVRDAVVYELYLRSFTPDGTFRGLQQRLSELQQLGVTVIWLMPIHPIGRSRRKGPLGSPYSIRDHYAVNPEFGTLGDFRSLLAATHDHGMKLIIDLVANHAAWDSRLLREHPEWFARDERGNIRPPFDDWDDVAQLDYTVPELRRQMIEMMLYWVRDVGVDGFRCDVAAMLPGDFWSEGRRELDAIRSVMMLAEDDQPAQHVRAFDLTYDWWTYQALGRLTAGKLAPAAIETILINERLDFPAGSLRLRFSSNHDLCAEHQTAAERYGLDAAKAAAALTYALPGVPLIYNGQEMGNTTRLPLFERVAIDWTHPQDSDLRGLYANLGRLRCQRRSLRRGETRILPPLAEKGILGIVRSWQNETTYVLINCAPEPCEIQTREVLSLRPVTLLGTTTPAKSTSGRSIELPPWGYWIGAAP